MQVRSYVIYAMLFAIGSIAVAILIAFCFKAFDHTSSFLFLSPSAIGRSSLVLRLLFPLICLLLAILCVLLVPPIVSIVRPFSSSFASASSSSLPPSLFQLHLSRLLGESFIAPFLPTSYIFRRPNNSINAYLALCAAVKERPEDVLEWVEYHSALGVGKFYLLSTDDPEGYMSMQTALQKYVSEGFVEIYALPHVNPRTVPLLQVRLYNECLQASRRKHAWVGFWDVDEFVVPIDPMLPTSIADILRGFEQHGALVLSWRAVGPSGHVARPSEGIVKSYRQCTGWDYPHNAEIKTIANTNFAAYPTTDPHTFVYWNGTSAVDIEKRRVEGHLNPHVIEDWKSKRRKPRLALYHYVTKSEEDFNWKAARGSAMGNRKGYEYFESLQRIANEQCNEAVEACVRVGLKSCVEARER